MSAYAHASLSTGSKRGTVRRGQVIARVGKQECCQSATPFELRRNNEPVDPRKYLARLAENYS